MSKAPEDRENDVPLEALLRQLSDHIRREELPDEIRNLAWQLETALRRRRKAAGDEASDGTPENPPRGAVRGCWPSSCPGRMCHRVSPVTKAVGLFMERASCSIGP